MIPLRSLTLLYLISTLSLHPTLPLHTTHAQVLTSEQPFIPGGQISSLGSTFYPAIDGHLLRGPAPTRIGFLLSNSVFESQQVL
jgi:hypothetical protein